MCSNYNAMCSHHDAMRSPPTVTPLGPDTSRPNQRLSRGAYLLYWHPFGDATTVIAISSASVSLPSDFSCPHLNEREIQKRRLHTKLARLHSHLTEDMLTLMRETSGEIAVQR